MNQQPSAPSGFTTIIPFEFVTLDRKVREGFLSSDLTKICEAAGETASVILISAAGQSLEQRQTAFDLWRKGQLERIGTMFYELGERFTEDPEGLDKYQDGSIDLLELDKILVSWRGKKATRRMDRGHVKNCGKRALNIAVHINTADALEARLPQFCVIRADGEMKLFRSRVTAKAWAMGTSAGYHLIPLDLEKIHTIRTQ